MKKAEELLFKTKLIMAEVELNQAVEQYRQVSSLLASHIARMDENRTEEPAAETAKLLTEAIRWHKEIILLRLLVKECRSACVYGFDEAIKKG